MDLKEGVYDDPEVWGLGSWAYFWKMGLFPEEEYGIGVGILEEDDEVTFGCVEFRCCGNIPIEMGRRQLGDGPGGENILVGNTDMGDFKTMVCSDEVTKR